MEQATPNDRVSAAYADERIAEKIDRLTEEKQRRGIVALDRTLMERAVPPGVRLHFITSVTHLGHIAEGTLAARQRRAQARLE